MSTDGQTTPAAADEYGEGQIRALEGVEGIRTRPAMYIGDTTGRGLHHLVYEVVDNSIDEAVNKHATTISVKINADGSVTCRDDGRGIPVGPMADMTTARLSKSFSRRYTLVANSTEPVDTRQGPVVCTA